MEDARKQSEEGEYLSPAGGSGAGQGREVARTFWGTALLREKAVIILGLVYAFSPIDLIPEVILGPLGLLDDGGAIFIVLLTVLGVLKRQQRSQAQKSLPNR